MRFNMVAALLFLGISISAGGAWGGEPVQRVVLIDLPNRDSIQELYRLKLTLTDAGQDFAKALATDEEIAAVRKAGLGVHILLDDYRQELSWLSEPDFTGYHNYSEMVAEINQIVADYPAITRLFNYGRSVQGRDLLALKISRNPDAEENEPEFRILGAHHGNETIANEIAIYMAHYLTENYGSNPTVTYLVNHREIWIMPMPNPDGVERGTRGNANGVDLNRDHGYQWDRWGGSPSPISQPENQAMRRLALDNNFAISLAYHSSARYVNYLWDYNPHLTQDNALIVGLSQGYADYSGYQIINGWDWYEVHGSCQDEEYGCYGTLGWTIETPQPAAGGIQGVCDDNDEAILYMLGKAGQGIMGTITDSSTGDPIPAVVDIEQVGWPIYADPVRGDYHRVLLPGTYTVKAWANGYQNRSHSGVVVTSDTAATVNLALSPAAGSSYATRVVTAQVADPRNSYNNYSLTPWCLGAPDDKALSVGVGGEIVLDMGSEVADGPGMDLRVYEGGFVAEYCDVYASETWNGPWSLLGRGRGSSNYDLAAAGLSSARYVRIVDDDNGDPNEGYPGFDLEAVRSGVPEGTISAYCDQVSVARGGTLRFSLKVYNNSDVSQTMQMWTEVYLPNGRPYQGNPVIGPTSVTIPAHQGVVRSYSHVIPAAAPLGTYIYRARLGSAYPLPLLDSDYFRFSVTAQ
jgi:hypothetical protein